MFYLILNFDLIFRGDRPCCVVVTFLMAVKRPFLSRVCQYYFGIPIYQILGKKITIKQEQKMFSRKSQKSGFSKTELKQI